MANKYKPIEKLDQVTLKELQSMAIKELMEWLKFLKDVNKRIK